MKFPSSYHIVLNFSDIKIAMPTFLNLVFMIYTFLAICFQTIYDFTYEVHILDAVYNWTLLLKKNQFW